MWISHSYLGSYLGSVIPWVISEPRATQVCDLTEEELQGYPTNNLDTERDFSVFYRLAKVAKMANRNFNTTDIKKNNMSLLGQDPEQDLTDAAKRVIPKLAERTANRTNEQLQLLALNDEEKL